jgi:hypothetical protein
MNRRDFLKKTGLSSAALASLPVAGGLASPAWAGNDNGGTRFRFAVLSTTATGSDVVAINGAGSFGGSWIRGGGSFTHWLPTGSPPFPIAAAGFWQATQLISFDPNGVYGTLKSGILVARARFRVTKPASARGRVHGRLKIVCNVGPGGLLTGLPEGVFIRVAGFEFEPLHPEVGLTIFLPDD